MKAITALSLIAMTGIMDRPMRRAARRTWDDLQKSTSKDRKKKRKSQRAARRKNR